MKRKFKIQGFYHVPVDNRGIPQDSDRQFYFRASDHIFSLNHHHRVQEVGNLPFGAKKILERDDDVNDQRRPTNEFYVEIDFIKSEFGDDITLFLSNGCIVSSYWNYIPSENISIPLLEFYTPHEVEIMEVSNNPIDIEDIKIKFL